MKHFSWRYKAAGGVHTEVSRFVLPPSPDLTIHKKDWDDKPKPTVNKKNRTIWGTDHTVTHHCFAGPSQMIIILLGKTHEPPIKAGKETRKKWRKDERIDGRGSALRGRKVEVAEDGRGKPKWMADVNELERHGRKTGCSLFDSRC